MEVNLTLDKVLEIVDGVASSVDSNFLIKNIRSLEDAKESDLAVILDKGDASVFDSISIDKIKNSTAGLILSSSVVVDGKNYIIVKDALSAFQKLFAYLSDQRARIIVEKNIEPSALIDPSAIICDGVKIGASSVIGAQVFIGRDCVIGAGVLIYPGVKILDRCLIGDGAIIHSGAVIGSDGFGYQVTKQGMKKIPQIGIVNVGRMVEVGANTCIDRAAFEETKIGDGVKIDNCVHVAHNVKIGAATAILAQTGIAGSAQIGIGCQIGGQVAIKNDVKIGNGVKIVSKSAVLNDLEDGAVVCGIPAIPFSKWKRIHVLQQKLPEYSKLLLALQKKKQLSLIQRVWDRVWGK
jgi:UDP-3-O-[3-hydroxymyristoyl] glucosamine N-acyltransferase